MLPKFPRNSLRALAALLPLTALLGTLLNGCGLTDPFPYGDAGDPLPAGATMISADQFFAMYEMEQLRPFKKSEAPKALPSGMVAGTANADPSIEVADRAGRPMKFKLMGPETRDAVIAGANTNYPTRDNQLAIYRSLRHKLPAGLNLGQATADASLDAADAPSLAELNAALAAHWQEIGAAATATAGSGSAPITPEECAQEEGYGLGGDRVGSWPTCAYYSPTGLQARASYPGKSHVTCVKNQGGRGTCVAFGVTSAVEMAIQEKTGKRVNLSEQDLYFRAKVSFPSSVSSFGDGLDPGSVLSSMISRSYTQPFENAWGYNVSYSRVENGDAGAYGDSCDGYGEYCSDTSHQGKIVCATNADGLYCGYATPAPQPGSGYQVKSTAELWDSHDQQKGLHNTLAMLAEGVPVVMGFSVTPDFDGPDANGYATYHDEDQKSRGGHAVHVTGYVTNADLALASPDAPPGAGGGYLIIKNSWSICWADGGYIYLPFDWTKRYVWSMVAITGLD